MSLRTSIILLSLAFGALVAVVVASLFANPSQSKLQTELEQMRRSAAPASVSMPLLSLPDLRDAPKKQACKEQFGTVCSPTLARPATITR